MFRVPSDGTYPEVKISFMRWLTSSAADRREWKRRRNAAAQAAGASRRAAIDATGAEYRARYQTRQGELREREAEIKDQLREQWQNRPR